MYIIQNLHVKALQSVYSHQYIGGMCGLHLARVVGVQGSTSTRREVTTGNRW